MRHNLSKSALRWLTQRVLTQAKLAGISYQDVMSITKKPEHFAWAFPSPVVEVYGRRFMIDRPARLASLESAYKVYQSILKFPSPMVLAVFEEPWLSGSSNPAVVACEFALALAETPSSLILGPDSCFVRVREAGKAYIFGIYHGQVESVKQNPREVEFAIDSITMTQGYQPVGAFDTFDIIDKLVQFDDINPHALMLLKDAESPEACYRLEQGLYNAPPVGAKPSRDEQLKYSQESLDIIRGIASEDRPLAERVEELYSVLVPDYMSKEWLAGILPERATKAELQLALDGIENLFKKVRNG